MRIPVLTVPRATTINVNRSNAKFTKVVDPVQPILHIKIETNSINIPTIIHYHHHITKNIDVHHIIVMILCCHLNLVFKYAKLISYDLKTTLYQQQILQMMTHFFHAQKINACIVEYFHNVF